MLDILRLQAMPLDDSPKEGGDDSDDCDCGQTCGSSCGDTNC